MYHAWYSAKAAANYGSNFYLNEAGEEVEITAVARDQVYGERYLWDDKVYVGQVTKTCTRKGQKGQYETERRYPIGG